MRRETINEKIRNQLTPTVNMLAIIKEMKKCSTIEELNKYLTMLYSLENAAENSVQKLCKLGYDKYETDTD